MVNLTIDGQAVQVEPGTSIIMAAKKLNIKLDVPHYCFHEGLSVAGNCRICLVEIEKVPKLQISCATPVAEGMVVYTASDKVKAARQGVMEFLLVNHPIDCPICDCAGECRLQDYYMQHGLHDSRIPLEQKVRKKKVVDIGRHVILDSERCILCSRCVRFCEEVPKTGELGIFNRGSFSELSLQEGMRLENDYSGNVVDICPVGALTDKSFRFRSRVWFLRETPSVCPGCERGCNIYIHHNDHAQNKVGSERVYRLKPRFNDDVNKWWMCDEGRYGYSSIDGNRVEFPQALTSGARTPLSWDEAFLRLTNALSGITKDDSAAVIASPHLTNEELYLVKKLFKDGLKLAKVHYGDDLLRAGKEDNILLKADRSPNRAGARAVADSPSAGPRVSARQILDDAKAGKIKTLILLDCDLDLYFDASEIEAALSKVAKKISFSSHRNLLYEKLVDLIIPVAVYAEKDGTFTNFEKRVQRIYPAFPPIAQAKTSTEIFDVLSQKMNLGWHFEKSAEIFDALTREVPAFEGLSYSKIGDLGKPMSPEVVHKSAG